MGPEWKSLTDGDPTVRQIRDHLAAGGVIARRSIPGGGYMTSDKFPEVAHRSWDIFPDQDAPMPNYRLVDRAS